MYSLGGTHCIDDMTNNINENNQHTRLQKVGSVSCGSKDCTIGVVWGPSEPDRSGSGVDQGVGRIFEERQLSKMQFLGVVQK